jgi:HEAT repeat protein
MTKPVYVEISTADPLHRAIIQKAITANDRQALLALKGRLEHPVHYVRNWFAYGLMDLKGAVVIYAPSARRDMLKTMQESQIQASELYPIPADDLYENLLPR